MTTQFVISTFQHSTHVAAAVYSIENRWWVSTFANSNAKCEKVMTPKYHPNPNSFRSWLFFEICQTSDYFKVDNLVKEKHWKFMVITKSLFWNSRVQSPLSQVIYWGHSRPPWRPLFAYLTFFRRYFVGSIMEESGLIFSSLNVMTFFQQNNRFPGLLVIVIKLQKMSTTWTAKSWWWWHDRPLVHYMK